MDAELYLHSSKASGKTPPTTKEPVVPEKDLPEIPKDLADTKAKGEQDKKKVETFCTEQELSLKQMLANTLIRWKDEQGERLLTAEERDAKIKEAEKNLSTICTPEVLGKASAAGEKKTKPSIIAPIQTLGWTRFKCAFLNFLLIPCVKYPMTRM